ncbi:MAG: 4-hydroxy-3-methylbut-2-enyl diphosphate reductase, partial [Pseudomonadota bacterium]|nr:4-hydroxy-3-methylbut-2-enyl diphosphate reductase [Pseudomonadota bacterium]
AAFRQRFETVIELAETAQETEMFPVMRALRDVPLEKADMAFLNGG